jgi:hypothetical protein
MCEEIHADQLHAMPAVLDIGGDIGALIIYTRPELRGREIEVSPQENTSHRTHTAVLERKVGASSTHCALFLALAAGDYTIWGDDARPAGTITIAGGQVAEVDWRTH